MDPPVDEDAILHGMLDGDSADPQPVTSIPASTAARNALSKSTASMSSSQSSMRRTRSTFAGSSASLGSSSRNSAVSIDQSTMLVGIDDLGLQGSAAAPTAAPARGGGMRYRKPLQSGNDDDGVAPLPARLGRTSTRSSTNLLSDDGMAPLSSARRGSTNSTNRLASRTNLRSTSDLAATGTGSPRAVGSLRRMSRDPGTLGSTVRLTGGGALGSTTRLADAPAPRRGSVGNLLGDGARAPLGSRKSSIATSSTALAKARTKSSGTLLGSMTSMRNAPGGAAATPPAPRKDAKACMSNIDAALLDAERNFRTPLVAGNGSPGPVAPSMPPVSARSSLHSALPSVGPGRTSITSSAASQRPGTLPPLPGMGESAQQQQQQQPVVVSDVSPVPRRFSRITSGAPITAALLHEAATQRKDTVRSVTNRLTDPDRYPDAFKHRIEAIHQRKLSMIQHQHELDPDDKLTPADLGAALPPMDHISDRAAAVTDRLYRPAPVAPAPPTNPASTRARPKPHYDASRRMDFFNEFARGASRIQDVPAATAGTEDGQGGRKGVKFEEAGEGGEPLAGIFGDVPLREGGIKKVTVMSMGNLTVIK
ncbi:hypothetical protein AMAG_07177 [Allomyces macrogynus ATCC 38327]|uniref:Uncharacterized protein n=1 Tax=Allomyces macrogynus (strain ATCC 38327) TaxID=578462 RepID=A0A0L0SHB8_ALLM3|nr:hypothetical protein AMAG_07177 [Allomyces macrogynus ATCC 38327]|eukprot:KNE61908.1 hypothetical protein AMAG_07177 [Allomyces macrogynus ATCC 38327]